MGNKWFAENATDAATWGKKFYKWDKEPIWTLRISLPKTTADKLMRNPNLNNIGAARSADKSLLKEVNNKSAITVLMGNVVP
jgi:hypothetical protein